jgi:hypothetical protein
MPKSAKTCFHDQKNSIAMRSEKQKIKSRSELEIRDVPTEMLLFHAISVNTTSPVAPLPLER